MIDLEVIVQSADLLIKIVECEFNLCLRKNKQKKETLSEFLVSASSLGFSRDVSVYQCFVVLLKFHNLNRLFHYITINFVKCLPSKMKLNKRIVIVSEFKGVGGLGSKCQILIRNIMTIPFLAEG